MAFSTFEEFADSEDAEWTLLLEIQRKDAAQTTAYLCDRPYATTDLDQPYMVRFAPIIGGEGLPRLLRRLGDPFSGSGSTAFGSVTLIGAHEEVPYTTVGGAYLINPDGDRWAINPQGDIWAWAISVSGLDQLILRRGANVVAKLAAPRRFFKYDSARVLMRGVISRIGGDDRGNTRVEIVDLSGAFRQARIPVGNLPLCFGDCRNITPKLVNAAESEYAVHDGQIQAVDQVFDDGVELSPSQFSVTPLTGRFKLNGFVPTGTLTCNVRGAVVEGQWLSSTQQIVAHLIARGGQSIEQVYEDLPSSTIGLYLDESASLGDTLSALLHGCAGDWNIDKLGVFRAHLHPVPGEEPGEVTRKEKLLGGLSWEEESRIYSAVRYLFRPNWTQLQPRVAASEEQAAFVQSEGDEGEVSLAEVDPEIQYRDSPRIRTYFVDEPGAQSAANRLLSIYGQIRRRATTALSYSQERELGQRIFLEDGKNVFRGVITAITDVRGRRLPKQEIEVLA